MLKRMLRSRKFVAFVVAIGLLAGLELGLHAFSDLAWSVRFLRFEKPDRKAIQSDESIPKCSGCNLILISLDTLRADHLGFLGDRIAKTPNLDKIAAKSVVFTSAYTNAYYTTPSHMTVFTSLYPIAHQVDSGRVRMTEFGPQELENVAYSNDKPQPLSEKYVTLAQVLKQNGYRTYWNGALRSKYLNLHSGFERGFDFFADTLFARGVKIGKYEPKDFDQKRLASIQLSSGKPAFVFLHSYVTHQPYTFRDEENVPDSPRIPFDSSGLQAGFKLRSQLRPDVIVAQRDVPPKSEDERKQITEACLKFDDLTDCFDKYLGKDQFWHAVGLFQNFVAIRFFNDASGSEKSQELKYYQKAYRSGVNELDRQVGQLWETLEKSGALGNSIIIFFSDHGEELLEHGKTSHAEFFEEVTRVPLLIYHPRLRHGLRLSHLVSLVDVMPTVLDLLEVPIPSQVQGQNALTDHDEYVIGQTLGWDYVLHNGWKLIRDRSGDEQMFYLPMDPLEKNNLAGFHDPWAVAAGKQLREERERKSIEQAL